ncbi:GNAT family N-acetyltransferase [Ensifer aridi]|uniref:GNAT family N-acetyltransferase n=1 Tax=Ensifer aridi TaxID=1708715 RepID=UPI0009BF792F
MHLHHVDSAPVAPARPDSNGLSLISGFDALYPDIEHWFASKVAPGLSDGSRRLLIERDLDSVRGFAILKKEAHERKICTLWVRPDQRRRGVGQRLIDESIAWLECEKPMLTVPEEAILDFWGLLTRNGFELRQRAVNYYRLGRCEYVFNGRLPGPLDGAIMQ